MSVKTLVVHPPAVRKPAWNAMWPTFFLGGSIEMGKAIPWQNEAIERLTGYASVIYNPRRPDWNPDWEQSLENAEFTLQVNWELDRIEEADFVIMYFDPNTMSPISMAEVGYLSALDPNKTLMCCPEGFWRKGNMDVMAERFGIHTFPTLSTLLDHAQQMAILYNKVLSQSPRAKPPNLDR